MKRFIVLIFLCVAALCLSACGGGASDPKDGTVDPAGDASGEPSAQTPSVTEPSDAGDPAPISITEVDLDEILSQGLPVILNFGDDSPASRDTLAALEAVQKELGGSILIYTVDLALNPAAREGFPVQVIPSQFFYMADGTPIPLPVSINIILSTFMSIETEEPVFTIHEGPLTSEEILIVLEDMGLVSLVWL